MANKKSYIEKLANTLSAPVEEVKALLASTATSMWNQTTNRLEGKTIRLGSIEERTVQNGPDKGEKYSTITIVDEEDEVVATIGAKSIKRIFGDDLGESLADGGSVKVSSSTKSDYFRTFDYVDGFFGLMEHEASGKLPQLNTDAVRVYRFTYEAV